MNENENYLMKKVKKIFNIISKIELIIIFGSKDTINIICQNCCMQKIINENGHYFDSVSNKILNKMKKDI